MVGYSHKTWSCPFFTWDERSVIRCECGRIVFPDFRSESIYALQYCAGGATAWKRCTLARNLLLYYEKQQEQEGIY